MWFLPLKVNKFFIIGLFFTLSINVGKNYTLPTPASQRNHEKLFTPPEIAPNSEDVTIDYHTNFMLRCESKVPIRWFYKRDIHNLETEEKKYDTQNPDRPYGTELTLSDVDAKYVRYYYCIYDDIEDDYLEDINDLDEIVDEGKASKIYVFVNDPNSLLAPGDDFNFHSVSEQTYDIVPCRPTTKDIDVILTGPSREEYKSKDKSANFDPHIGFKIFFQGVINSGDYICAPDTQPVNRQHELTFVIHVDKKQSFNSSESDISNFIKEYSDNSTISFNNNNDNTKFNPITITTSNTATISSTTIIPISTLTVINPSISTVILDVTGKTAKISKREFSNGNNPFSTESSFKSEPHIEHVRIIKEPENKHVIEGDNFNLTCEIKRSLGTLLKIDWDHKNKDKIQADGRWYETSETLDNYFVRVTLTIYSANKNTDTGEYKCYASDVKKQKDTSTVITVLAVNEDYIELEEPTKTYKIEQKRGQKIRIVVNYKGHPKPEIEWLKPDQTKITSSDKLKFEINTNEAKSVLNIKNAQLTDSGNYTARAYNDKGSKSVQFQILIRSQPITYLEPVHYAMVNESIKIECLVDAFPEPIITWTFIPCKIEPKWPNCDARMLKKLENAETFPHLRNLISYKSTLNFIPDSPGKVMCSAKNKINETTKETEIRIGDIPDPVFILNPGDDTKIAVGDQITLTCAALAYNYSDTINWFLDDRMVENSKDVEVIKERTSYSYKTNINFKSIDHKNSATYECRAISIADDLENKFTVINVYDPVDPILSEDSIKDGLVVLKKMGESAELKCDVTECIPIPTINWFKDNEPIIEDDNIGLENGNTTLRIRFVRLRDSEGIYKCVISNRLRTVERSAEIKVSDVPVGIHVGWIAAIIVFILILIIFIIVLCIRVYKDAQIRKQLKEIGIENFEEGCVGQINESMTLDEQAELLPYDKNRYEFPKEKIHLGKQLGQGAFGVVHKAVCDGILPDEKETIVAVKMVKKSADNEVIRALASELKIMVHLGQHLNVVNLLGAVTKNIFKREMMVIVEYCRYGNIQNFLLKNRKRFVNQINLETDLIDPAITSNDKRFSTDYEYNSRRISENDPRSGTRPGRPNSQGYIRQSELYYASEVDSAMTQQTVVDGEEILSNNSVQPIWRSNYKSDSATDQLEITTSHLVSWAFQVARGMDYLASRKVLHGDLAARNILLCEDNIVKICDFGLARSVIKNENYQKSEEARLPVKWLALESLGERVFSTRSDVWSFGIVLWEFFSLSKVPYPGIDANGGTLYEKLKDGYRMEKPAYANQELYEIMLECWRANPDSRPLFDELERRFGRMLEEEVTNHYIDLNEHYLRINEEYQKTNPTDWIALMGSPTEIAPPVPRYVNESIIPEIKIDNTEDYLKMSPKTGKAIFSPRPTSDDYVKATNQFDFPVPLSPTTSNNIDSPVLKNRNKENIIPEEIPMLARQSYSDSEPEQSPTAKDIIKKFNSYNNTNNSINVQNNNIKNSNKVAPITIASQPPSLNNAHQKFISNDNYVNVKSKAPLAGSDAFTNPSYLILQNANEKKK
ncbi:platelet-derived growth factor receptor alpha isoform X2 [Condylostylus longicornis]|uniref:platelet-derived growth factor receptor alpha isoform X2 n=1 Tax=Condylostylus longicornis TaxID=2530218 RepID=UPI00244DC0CF|nr:platelet-derived growth factor receptor alpha isoform X2 [Condylostylus longicornis]